MFLCAYVRTHPKKTWRITNIFSVRIREDNWYTCQAVDICFHDFCWTFLDHGNLYLKHVYLMQAVPFHHLQGVKMIKMLWCLRGTWASKKPPVCLTRKAGNSQWIRSYSRVYILYWYNTYIYIFLYCLYFRNLAITCVVLCLWNMKAGKSSKKRIFFVSAGSDNENEPPIQSTTCLWPKNTVLEHSTTLPNQVEVHRFF